jgi:hypothetical protein
VIVTHYAVAAPRARLALNTGDLVEQPVGKRAVQARRLDAIAATRHGHVSVLKLTTSGGPLTVARTIPDSWPRNPARPAPPSSRKTPRRRAAWFRPDYRGNSNRQPANGRSQETVVRAIR